MGTESLGRMLGVGGALVLGEGSTGSQMTGPPGSGTSALAAGMGARQVTREITLAVPGRLGRNLSQDTGNQRIHSERCTERTQRLVDNKPHRTCHAPASAALLGV